MAYSFKSGIDALHVSINSRSASAGIAPFFVAQTEPAAFAKSAASRSSASLISETLAGLHELCEERAEEAVAGAGGIDDFCIVGVER